MTTEDFKLISDTIPKQPGVYRFIDDKDVIIYVGKAKKLRNRISSYFGDKKAQAYKTRTMVKNAKRLEFTVVETEADALLLENTLIKKFQPRYNVMLKDAKSYTYLCIKNERFPRVFFTRKVVKDGSKYYGPYTSKWKTNQIFEIIKSLFPLRTCKYNLSDDNIMAGKFKVCLEYHLKNCLGPCENLETELSYNERIVQVKNILNGNFKPVKDFIKSEMERFASELKFEEAEVMKEKLITYIQTELLNQQHEITPEQDLLISGLIDSIGVMRLVGFIERDLETTIPPKDVTLENFGNVNTIVSYIDSQIATT